MCVWVCLRILLSFSFIWLHSMSCIRSDCICYCYYYRYSCEFRVQLLVSLLVFLYDFFDWLIDCSFRCSLHTMCLHHLYVDLHWHLHWPLATHLLLIHLLAIRTTNHPTHPFCHVPPMYSILLIVISGIGNCLCSEWVACCFTAARIYYSIRTNAIYFTHSVLFNWHYLLQSHHVFMVIV